ncbi:MAG: nucleotidyltransferase domain-containing protein [Deltaproteobacteria bacterium]|jgi:predicted nucleotidyltransferase|nr:nucleotidyltransferase domain-containing protein [Deltaproteobacteria bacterium]
MALESNTQTGFGGGRPGDPLRTTETIAEAVKQYAEKVRSSFPVVKAYLFGSWTKGKATFNSDTDVCFFLENWGGKTRKDALIDISIMTMDFPWAFIEPHVFLASALEVDSFFIEEILKTGIEI